MSSASRKKFTFSYPRMMSSISSYCLIALDRASSTVLNRSGTFALCLVLEENLCFSPLSIIFNVSHFLFKRQEKEGGKIGRETLMFKRNIHQLPLKCPQLGT